MGLLAATIASRHRGGGGGFTPPDIGGLMLWLDASDASTLYDATSGGSPTAPDGTVARWIDKSAQVNNSTQGTSGSRPTRKTSVQNGLDALLWDGGDSLVSSTNVTSAAPRSVFVVAKASAALGGTVFFFRQSAPGGVHRLLRTGGITYIGGDGSATNQSIAADISTTWQSWGQITWSQDASRNFTFRFNGTGHAVSGNPPNAESGSAGYVVGTLPGVGQFWSGHIGEIIIYDTQLGSTDRDTVEAYLKAKWATP